MCVDTGSTFTKAAAVGVEGPDEGRLLAVASVPTTVGPGQDVLTGLDAAVAEVARTAGGSPREVRVCSSAGGGLRLAVVGYERIVTAEAGRRVGLSAGSKVVHVSGGQLDREALAALAASRPDVILLVGGTDGGDAEVLRHNASRLATLGPRVPYVVAGNADARDDVLATFQAKRRTVVATANVLPRIGMLDPAPARAAIRDVFVHHVIGGKGLTTGPRFASLVRGATPDLVLAGVELYADSGAGDVLLVDVGGATTDVYSALTPDAEEAGLHREVVEVMWRGRTPPGVRQVRGSGPDRSATRTRGSDRRGDRVEVGVVEVKVGSVDPAVDLVGPTRTHDRSGASGPRQCPGDRYRSDRCAVLVGDGTHGLGKGQVAVEVDGELVVAPAPVRGIEDLEPLACERPGEEPGLHRRVHDHPGVVLVAPRDHRAT